MNGISVAPLEEGDEELGAKCSCEDTVANDDDGSTVVVVTCCSDAIVVDC